jgi:hypothetical protein
MGMMDLIRSRLLRRAMIFFDKVITTEREVVDPATQSKKMVRTPVPSADGHGFGVVTADLNGDGQIEIFVANDMNPNFPVPEPW